MDVFLDLQLKDGLLHETKVLHETKELSDSLTLKAEKYTSSQVLKETTSRSVAFLFN